MRETIQKATIVAISSVLLACQCTASIAQTSAADRTRNAIECVQKQLNALGHRSGTITGVIDEATRTAGNAYVADMKRQDPNWAMEMISARSALLWCEKVADAHRQARKFWVAYQDAEAAAKAAADPAADLSADELFQRAYKYHTGNGVPVDEAEAVRWYKLAVKKGSVAAMRNLAGMYGSGRGTERNDREAGRLFGMAAAQGDPQAQYAMGKWYSKTAGQRLTWLTRAAKQGHAEAIAELAALEQSASGQEGADPQQPSATPAGSAWSVAKSPEGQCVALGKPTSTSAELKGEHDPRLMVVHTPGSDPNMFVAEIAGPVEQAQTYINIDGTMFPAGAVKSGYQFVLIARSADADGKVMVNSKPVTRVAHLAIVRAMQKGKWLAVQTVVRRGKDTGKTYVDLYSLAGFAEAKAQADQQCGGTP